MDAPRFRSLSPRWRQRPVSPPPDSDVGWRGRRGACGWRPVDTTGLRSNLLATRVWTATEFLQEMETERMDSQALPFEWSRSIPVLLRPGESTQQYDRHFERWLAPKDVTLTSLDSDPIAERRFRLEFAWARAEELSAQPPMPQPTAVDASTGTWSRASSSFLWRRSTSPVRRNAPKGQPYAPSRSRAELLATRVVSFEEFTQQMGRSGPDGAMRSGESLRPIAVLLRPWETTSEFEQNFQRWLTTTGTTLASLKSDPNEERRYRQCFAFARVREYTRKTSARSAVTEPHAQSPTGGLKKSESSEAGHKRRRCEADGRQAAPTVSSAPPSVKPQTQCCSSKEGDADACRTGDGCCWPVCMRNWATNMETKTDCRFRELEQEVKSLRRRLAEDNGGYSSPANAENQPLEAGSPRSNSIETDCAATVSGAIEDSSASATDEDDPAVKGEEEPSSPVQHTEIPWSTEAEAPEDAWVSHPSDNKLPTNAEILRNATETLANVGQKRVPEDPTRKRLANAYIHLIDEILLKKTAKQDSLACFKTIMDVDKANAMEKHNHVMELSVSINLEKARRDAAFATLIVYEWSERREELERLLRSDRVLRSGVHHAEYAAISSELDRKEAAIQGLEVKLKNRVRWLKAGDTGRESQFEELRELASKLAAETSAKCLLEDQRQELCVSIVKTKRGIRKLVNQAMQEAEGFSYSVRDTTRSLA
ncbi:hypothetical protein BBJ28_00002855 [Nothophytophthora sp. Chile5]|nr:hypothetical protein BBJ28_00002855 [Nothophytophthora sp. Chile5]